ncbi:MAG: SDR family NAD(P)-dependent oxidoreductase, partial [Chloroflexus sp.]
MRVQNKVMVVTGGSGIGRALAFTGERGAGSGSRSEFGVVARDDAIGGAQASRLSTHELNITDRAAMSTLPAQVVAVHGAVNGLFNHAGITQPVMHVPDLDEATIERIMKVNFYGTVWMTKACLPHLLARPAAHIVHVSRMGGCLSV